MFVITRGKGFRITFANGWGLSVQFGIGNYCDNRDRFDEEVYHKRSMRFSEGDKQAGADGSRNAEIAIINPFGELDNAGILKNGDEVEGWCTPERVLEVLNAVAKLGEKQ